MTARKAKAPAARGRPLGCECDTSGPRRRYRAGCRVHAAPSSGPSLTAAQRRENGLELVQGLWLPADMVRELDALCRRTGRTRTAIIGEALIARLARELTR